MALIVLLSLLLIPFGCAAWAASLAEERGRTPVGLGMLGLLLGPLGVVIAAVMSPDRVALAQGGGTLRRCPHCAEQIQAEARICRFCQRDV